MTDTVLIRRLATRVPGLDQILGGELLTDSPELATDDTHSTPGKAPLLAVRT
jgi:hypothetical protein